MSAEDPCKESSPEVNPPSEFAADLSTPRAGIGVPLGGSSLGGMEVSVAGLGVLVGLWVGVGFAGLGVGVGLSVGASRVLVGAAGVSDGAGSSVSVGGKVGTLVSVGWGVSPGTVVPVGSAVSVDAVEGTDVWAAVAVRTCVGASVPVVVAKGASVWVRIAVLAGVSVRAGVRVAVAVESSCVFWLVLVRLSKGVGDIAPGAREAVAVKEPKKNPLAA